MLLPYAASAECGTSARPATYAQDLARHSLLKNGARATASWTCRIPSGTRAGAGGFSQNARNAPMNVASYGTASTWPLAATNPR
eukprot:15474417-Alexandrium_andersonii.AAC.1